MAARHQQQGAPHRQAGPACSRAGGPRRRRADTRTSAESDRARSADVRTGSVRQPDMRRSRHAVRGGAPRARIWPTLQPAEDQGTSRGGTATRDHQADARAGARGPLPALIRPERSRSRRALWGRARRNLEALARHHTQSRPARLDARRERVELPALTLELTGPKGPTWTRQKRKRCRPLWVRLSEWLGRYLPQRLRAASGKNCRTQVFACSEFTLSAATAAQEALMLGA